MEISKETYYSLIISKERYYSLFNRIVRTFLCLDFSKFKIYI